ncbi:MAG: type II secretion system protein GspM [Kofleriaceae bacterium]
MAALDKLRDKWESITPRERRMVVVLGVSFVVVMILYFSLAIKDGLDRLEAKNGKARAALRKLTAYKASVRSPAGGDPTAVIPVTPVKLESYIYKAGETAQLTVPGVNPRSPVTRGRFMVHAAQVDIRDVTLTQVKDFLQALETDSAAVKVTSLELKRDYRDQEKLTLSLEVSTYSKVPDGEGEGEAAAGTAAGAGGAP